MIGSILWWVVCVLAGMIVLYSVASAITPPKMPMHIFLILFGWGVLMSVSLVATRIGWLGPLHLLWLVPASFALSYCIADVRLRYLVQRDLKRQRHGSPKP